MESKNGYFKLDVRDVGVFLQVFPPEEGGKIPEKKYLVFFGGGLNKADSFLHDLHSAKGPGVFVIAGRYGSARVQLDIDPVCFAVTAQDQRPGIPSLPAAVNVTDIRSAVGEQEPDPIILCPG